MANISLAEVAANKRTIEVDLGLPPAEDGTAQTLTVTYRVNAQTAADELRMRGVAGKTGISDEDFDYLLGFLCRMVASWGLTGPLTGADGVETVAAGKPVPIDSAVMKVLPATLITKVMQACQQDIADPKASTTSAA